jgi:hypothetical protein
VKLENSDKVSIANFELVIGIERPKLNSLFLLPEGSGDQTNPQTTERLGRHAGERPRSQLRSV